MLQACLNLSQNFSSYKKLFKNEKELQTFVENNLSLIFNYTFIKSEHTLKSSINNNFRFDTLAFNPQNSSIKVIEYKNHKYDWLIEQGLSYLMTLHNNFDDLSSLIESKLGKTSINKQESSIELVTPELTPRQQLIYFNDENNIYNHLNLFIVESQRNKLFFWKTQNIDDFNNISKSKELLGLNLWQDLLNKQNNAGEITLKEFIWIWFTGTEENILNKIKIFLELERQLKAINKYFTFDFWNWNRRHAFIKYKNKTIANFNPFEYKDYSTLVFHVKEFRQQLIKKDSLKLIYIKGKDENLRFNLSDIKEINYILNLFNTILK